MIDFKETSFLEIENDVSFFLQQYDSGYPLFLNHSVEIFYYRHLQGLLLESASLFQINNDSLLPILIFLRYLLRSNLCFDLAFFKPIQLKQSKLALMYGDLYLAKAGKSFQAIPDYDLLGDALIQTLKKISSSQWLQPTKPVELSRFAEMNSLRYGSLFELSFSIPFFLHHQASVINTEQKNRVSHLALYCTIMKNSSLFPCLLAKRVLLLNKLKKKINQ